jgi:cell division protein FtsL
MARKSSTGNAGTPAVASSVDAAVPLVQLAVLLCLLLVLGSALSVVYLAQHSRLLFAELEGSRKAQYELDSQWNRLILERSTLLSPANIERVASKKLAMVLPPPAEVVVVKP